MTVIGALSPALVGYLSDTVGFTAAFVVLIVGLLFGIAVISVLKT